jgi:hypothetical protein
MDEKTLTALDGSIAKWKEIVAGRGTDEGINNCPLCAIFYYAGAGCEGCPVSAKTGAPECDGSPYRDEWVHVAGDGEKATEAAQIAAAQSELDFLISLRPTKAA